MPIISCPYCGAERNAPADKLPNKPCNARCPECRRQFTFVPACQPSDGDNPAESLAVTCPHCGLQRSIAADRLKNRSATISCRRCQHSFSAIDNLKNKRTPQLRPIGTLLSDSWELFCRRGWGLLAIYLFGSLLIFAPPLLTGYLLADKIPLPRNLTLTVVLLGSGYLLFCGAWLSGAMFLYLCHPELGLFAAISRGLRKVWSFAALLLLTLLLIGGGSLLLVVPGLIFCGWFFFAQLILADENIGGLRALEKSRLLVRGNWWALGRRLLLLFLVALAISILSARLPLIGAPVHFIFSLLLTPFSLIYCYLTYLDFKRGYRGPAQPKTSRQWLPLTVAVLGWLLLPAIFFVSNPQALFHNSKFKFVQTSETLSGEPESVILDAPPPFLPQPQTLSLADYDRLLGSGPVPLPHQGVKLGPLALTRGQYWEDRNEPHLWLKLSLTDFPNLAISRQRSTKVIIDQVLDSSDHDHYNPDNNFEHPAFYWINFFGQDGERVTGVRSVYLQQGTKPEQIRSILGRLEINLPIGIKQLRLNHNDIGKSIQIAGKQLSLDNFADNRISLSFRGKREELLSIRGTNQAHGQLAATGNTWQQHDGIIKFNQMFSGPVDQITILVASDSVTRRYPFEITR